MLSNRFGYRPVVMMGGFLISLGTITSAFTNSINEMYITIGFVSGTHKPHNHSIYLSIYLIDVCRVCLCAIVLNYLQNDCCVFADVFVLFNSLS